MIVNTSFTAKKVIIDTSLIEIDFSIEKEGNYFNLLLLFTGLRKRY